MSERQPQRPVEFPVFAVLGMRRMRKCCLSGVEHESNRPNRGRFRGVCGAGHCDGLGHSYAARGLEALRPTNNYL